MSEALVEELNRLRLRAFKSNSEADKAAYFDRLKNSIESEAERLAEEDGYAWDLLTEDYESPLNEFTSKSAYRRKAKEQLDP